MLAIIPSIDLTLKPFGSFRQVEKLGVHIRIKNARYAAGDELFIFHKEVVTIPFCPILGQVSISDDMGEIPVTKETRTANFQTKEMFYGQRASQGDMVINYHVAPRLQPENYRSSPYFDLVAEPGGANGAGITFLPLFPEDKYQFSLHWDLEHMPKGCRGIWSLAEGDIKTEIEARHIGFSYYAFGDIKSLERDNYGIYWFEDPPFDIDDLGNKVGQLFAEMSRLFEDEGLPYKIFLRNNSFSGQGGTAAYRSYMLGYSPRINVSAISLTSLLAHEMVHNWLNIFDEPYGSGNWYSEGTAQFYSTMLPYRLGLVDLDYTRAAVQKAADDYYANPSRHLSFPEAAKLFWEDRNTQRIPYGRGFIYVANLDAAIRQNSKGAESLDDLARDILRLQKDGEQVDNDYFLKLASKRLGRDARPEYDLMVSGELFAPRQDVFDQLFTITESKIQLDGYEQPQKSYKWSIRE